MSRKGCLRSFKSCFLIVTILYIVCAVSAYLFWRYVINPKFDPDKRLYVSRTKEYSILFLFDDIAVRKIQHDETADSRQNPHFYDLGHAFWTGNREYAMAAECQFYESKTWGKKLDALFVDSERKIIVGKDDGEYFLVRGHELVVHGDWGKLTKYNLPSGMTQESLLDPEYFFTNTVFRSRPRGMFTNATTIIEWMDAAPKKGQSNFQN